MNCVDLQASLVEREDARSTDQRAHMKTCPKCSSLVAELNLIAAAAGDLRAAEEPSPQVWNSIATALRKEGLIRPQRSSRSLLPSFGSQTWVRWMVPAAAVLLIAVGLYVRQHSLVNQLAHDSAPVPVPDAAVTAASEGGLNDADLLQEVAQLSPALQAQYTDDLQHVNEYIRDAKGVVADNPNDEEARRSLLEAYQEKAMLFDLAMDRSLQ
jgi:hypothetical protein